MKLQPNRLKPLKTCEISNLGTPSVYPAETTKWKYTNPNEILKKKWKKPRQNIENNSEMRSFKTCQ